MTTDPREWSIGDWTGIFVRAVPGFVLAFLAVVAPLAAMATLVWWLLPLPL